MEGYELTDRGKIVLTVILAVLLFFLPAAILIFSAIASQPPDIPVNEDSKASAAPPPQSETPPPVITESPPPSGGGFNPPDTSPPTDGGAGEQEPPASTDPSPPPGTGQSVVDPIEGTLSFFFSPNEQNNLDAGTSSMLDEFLGSLKNTQDSIIAIETPKLTDEISDVFIPVITGALESRGVEDNRIAYITDQRIPLADAFEVNLSYVPRTGK